MGRSFALDGPVPQVIIAGFARSGTTLLARVLADEPGILVAGARPPEPKVLVDWRGSASAAQERYAQAFADADPGSLLIEKSTSYSDHLDVFARARGLLPEVKWVFVLRDPVERMVSNVNWSAFNGMESRSLDEALTDSGLLGSLMSPGPRPHDYVWRSLYGNHLHAWARYWPRTSVHLVQFERLMADWPVEYGRLLDFIELPASSRTRPSEAVNAAPRKVEPLDSPVLRKIVRDWIQPDAQLLADEWPSIDLSMWATLEAISRQSSN